MPEARCWCSAPPRSTWPQFEGIATLGLTAGASAPEVLVEEIVDAFRDRFDVRVENVVTARENIAFNVPRELRDAAPAAAATPA